MKEDEKAFFITCLRYSKTFSFREIINILSEFINYKRCHYLLKKWTFKDFYNWGTCMDLGWFEYENFTGEYKEIYESEVEDERKK